MTVEELTQAQRVLRTLRLPLPVIPTRRYLPGTPRFASASARRLPSLSA